MKVRLDLIGPFRLPPGGRTMECRYPRGTRIGSILEKELGYSREELGFLQVIREGHPVHLDNTIDEDMELQITLRLGGG